MPSRFIAHNIMGCRDIVRHYGQKNAPAGCLIKIEAKNAYDAIEWDFLEEMMCTLNFMEHFLKIF